MPRKKQSLREAISEQRQIYGWDQPARTPASGRRVGAPRKTRRVASKR